MKKQVVEKLNGHSFEVQETILDGFEVIGKKAFITCEDGGENDIIIGVIVGDTCIFEERFTIEPDFVEKISNTFNVREMDEVDEEVYDLLKEFDTAIHKLNLLAEEIADQHANNMCDHDGYCELVTPFLKYMEEHPEEVTDFEYWANDMSTSELYDRLFCRSTGIKYEPQEHVADVARWLDICHEHTTR